MQKHGRLEATNHNSKWVKVHRNIVGDDIKDEEKYMALKYIKKEHLKTFANLPTVKDHNDPSDRIIISQSITENIPLISSDTAFPLYRKHGLDLIEN